MINTIQQIDALELLKSIEPESVDLVFTDPPYNTSQRRVLKRTYKSGKQGDVNLNFGEWDFSYNPIPFLEQALRIVSPTGSIIVFSSEELYGVYRAWLGEHMHFRSPIIWCKPNPLPSFTKVSYLSGVEYMLWATRESTRNNPNFRFTNQADMKNWFISPVCAGKERIRDPEKHPTQKPEAVIRRVMSVHCREGGLVVDPYCGYGTVLAVAKKLGMNYIGGDLNPVCVEVSNRRLAAI